MDGIYPISRPWMPTPPPNRLPVFSLSWSRRHQTRKPLQRHRDRASIVSSQILEQRRQWSRFVASALCHCFQKHRLGIRIGFESFVALHNHYGHGCAFRQVGIHFDATTDDLAWGDQHLGIVGRFTTGAARISILAITTRATKNIVPLIAVGAATVIATTPTAMTTRGNRMSLLAIAMTAMLATSAAVLATIDRARVSTGRIAVMMHAGRSVTYRERDVDPRERSHAI
jgi:hypothetical protein